MIDERALQRFSDPEALHWWVDVPTRFADLDANGHANNAAVMGYVEEARVSWRRDALDGDASSGRWVVAATAIRYLSPIGYPCTLRVGLVPVSVGTTSFQLGYGVFHAGACMAVAVSRSVHLGASGDKAPLPETLREVLVAALEAG